MRFEGKERVEFAKTMAALGVAYSKDITEELMKVYEIALHGVPVGTIKRCALEHMQTSKFFPKPCELRPERSPEAKRALGYRSHWKSTARKQAALSREDYLRIEERQRAEREKPLQLEYKPAGEVLDEQPAF